MLSPAVRAAAEHIAITAPLGQEEGWLKNDRVNFYLRGYAAGYTAPRTARFPLAGDQAFKRLLGAYLAENITVYHPASGRYGLLRGLPACYAHDGEPFAEVEFYADADAREEGCGDLVEPYGKLLLVLYGFDVLGEQANSFRSDAVAHAAMMGLAAAMHGGEVTEIVEAHYSVGNGRSRIWLQYEDEEGDYCDAYLWDDGSAQDANDEAMQMSGWLRAAHFAVGLAPHQYHRRQPGFDYASGGKPLRMAKLCNCETDPPCHCGDGEASHGLGRIEHDFKAMPMPCTGDCTNCTGGVNSVVLHDGPDLNQLPF